MAITVTESRTLPVTDTTQSTQVFRGNIVFSGNYVAGGDTVNLSGVYGIQSNSAPLELEVIDKSASPAGYQIKYVYGTSSADGKIKILTADGTELPAGAYPSGLTTGPFTVKAYFPTFI